MQFVRRMSSAASRGEVDLVSQLFLNAIRNSTATSTSSPHHQMQLDEEMGRLGAKYNFPNTEAVGQLSVDFQPPSLTSSVAAVVGEEQSVDAIMKAMTTARSEYEKARLAKIRDENENPSA